MTMNVSNGVMDHRIPVPPQHPPPQHLPQGQVVPAHNGHANIGQPRSGPFMNPSQQQLEAMANHFKRLSMDSGAMARNGNGGLERDPFRSSMAYRDDVPLYPQIFEYWTLTRADPIPPETKKKWSRVVRTKTNLPQDELAKLAMNKRKRKTVREQLGGIRELQRKQINRLVHDRKASDDDTRIEWTVVYIDQVTKDIGRRGLWTEFITTQLNLIIERRLRPGLSSPRHGSNVLRSEITEVVDLDEPIVHRERGRESNFPPDMFEQRQIGPGMVQQNGHSIGGIPGGGQPQNVRPIVVDPRMGMDHQFPGGQRDDFAPQHHVQHRIPPQGPPAPPHGVEIINGPAEPNRMLPPPPPSPPIQGQQPPQQHLPNFINRPPNEQKHHNAPPPKIVNNEKKPPKDAMEVNRWLENESISDDETSLFSVDYESSHTDDSSFIGEHDKYLRPNEAVSHVRRRGSQGGHDPQYLYRVHQRPTDKYPGYNGHRRRDSGYGYGMVEIRPANSMHRRRPDRPSRSASVSYPTPPRLTYPQKQDQHGPLSPSSPQAFSPPARFDNPRFPDHPQHESQFERQQRERERSAERYVQSRRKTEQESFRPPWDQGPGHMDERSMQPPKHPADHYPPAPPPPPPAPQIPRQDRFDKYERMEQLNRMAHSGAERPRMEQSGQFNNREQFGNHGMDHHDRMDGDRMDRGRMNHPHQPPMDRYVRPGSRMRSQSRPIQM
ncbi:hypothetical protein FQN55_004011 [Onygenales sp. PD_40]|nr:hypothetical protein FQN55_004011 [Onygenales sp. PD_40]KAK2780779.1 hypothetical protein FQN53_000999 [Emmonsiellopsis sp. PD_33]KAK2786159.1 hypothetical protein FQN51_003635 [Onygenales sp. PD_10]KAK2791426.1 hypothetical protein FQN52_004860 [Onygenales sp. PD_12]